MDREYLEDYEQREKAQFEKLLKDIQEDNFSFEKDRYPPDERFIKLQKPVAFDASLIFETSDFWSQVPFSGSLIITLPPHSKSLYEKNLFEISEIPKIIDFIKETGRLQVAFNVRDMREYEGLDFLDPFFKELNPPSYAKAPISILANVKEIKKASYSFYTLAKVRCLDYLRNSLKTIEGADSLLFQRIVRNHLETYTVLKVGHYAIVDDIENLMIDDPAKALGLLSIYESFVVAPFFDLRSDLRNHTFEDIRSSRLLPLVYQPQEIRFPREIGEFLLKELTYAPQGLRACYDLIDHYDAYDLQKVLESLNEAIVSNHPDIVNKSAEELSEILENTWNDPTIPRRVKGLKIGIPLSMAAIGSVAAGPIGAAGGFLAGLGFDVAHKFIDVETTGLSEKLAKLRTNSYQVNVYDFKKKYKGKIAHP